MGRPLKILFIPDTQARPGDDFDFLRCIGEYIMDKRPDVIVHAGDFADMESCSSWDIGKKSFEGRRYRADIEAAHEAMEALLGPMRRYNLQQRRNKKAIYRPRMVMTMGNHEDRITRCVNGSAMLDGTIGLADLKYEYYGWEVHDFLNVVTINGVGFSHFFQTGAMGRPAGSAQAQLAKKHMSTVAGHQQGLSTASAYRADGARITSIIAGSCMHTSHKVLTSDLRYVPLSEIKVGDQLISFDEGPLEGHSGQRGRPRRFKTGTVTNLRLSRGEMFDVTLSSGKTFRVTGDHLWFTKNSGSLYSWKRTDQLRITNKSALGKKGGGTRVVKLLDEFDHNQSWESGWLAGMYCGEGSLYHRRTTGGSVMQLALSQSESHNSGTCRRIEDALRDVCGVETVTHCSAKRTVGQYRITGGARGIAKVLGTVRPPRMLDKFVPEMLGSLTTPGSGDAEHFVSITPVGEDEYVEIEIDAKTMIVEGYGHHNCYEHKEGYLGPQGNQHWHGVVMLHNVCDGEFDPMYVPLHYIKSKYSGSE